MVRASLSVSLPSYLYNSSVVGAFLCVFNLGASGVNNWTDLAYFPSNYHQY